VLRLDLGMVDEWIGICERKKEARKKKLSGLKGKFPKPQSRGWI
jgi:hypothetical protein